MVYVSPRRERFEKRYAFLDFVRTHPEATADEIRATPYRDVFEDRYQGNVGYARIAAQQARPLSYWKRRIRAFLRYLDHNPEETRDSVFENGHARILRNVYDCAINEARHELGIIVTGDFPDPVPEHVWQERYKALEAFLKKNRAAAARDIRRAGHEAALRKLYHGRPNEARAAFGLPQRRSGRPARDRTLISSRGQ